MHGLWFHDWKTKRTDNSYWTDSRDGTFTLHRHRQECEVCGKRRTIESRTWTSGGAKWERGED